MTKIQKKSSGIISNLSNFNAVRNKSLCALSYKPKILQCKWNVKSYLIVRALLINLVGLIVITVLCFLAGLVIYAKYFDCDPIKNKVKNNKLKLSANLKRVA